MMKIHKSAEDNLEKILMLKEAKGTVRSIDIANALSVSKPSVSVAMRRLRANGYITMDANNLIDLTDQGLDIAQRIYKRHKALTQFLIQIGVDEDTARQDACEIEHDISAETFKAIQRQLVQL